VNITALPALHWCHGGQTAGTGAAQQPQHQGLGLILTMMGQQQRILFTNMSKQRLAARPARALLKIALAGHIDSLGNKVNARQSGLTLAMCQPLVGVGMQAMMHMHCQQTLSQAGPAQGGKQHRGVEAAGIAQHQTAADVGKAVAKMIRERVRGHASRPMRD